MLRNTLTVYMKVNRTSRLYSADACLILTDVRHVSHTLCCRQRCATACIYVCVCYNACGRILIGLQAHLVSQMSHTDTAYINIDAIVMSGGTIRQTQPRHHGYSAVATSCSISDYHKKNTLAGTAAPPICSVHCSARFTLLRGRPRTTII